MWAVIERCQWWWMMLGVNGQLNSSPSCSAVSTTAALRPDKRVRKCQAAESKRCEQVFCGEKKKKSHLSSSNSSTLIFYACKSGCSLIPPQLGRFSSQLFCYVQLVLQSYRCNHCLNYKATLVTTHWLHLHWRDLILDLIAAYVFFCYDCHQTSVPTVRQLFEEDVLHKMSNKVRMGTIESILWWMLNAFQARQKKTNQWD